MPSRPWIAGVAIGLALASAALAQEPSDPVLEREPVPEPRQEQGTATGQENGGEEQQPPADITPVLQGIEAAIRDLIAEEDQNQREREEQREITDLQAQQDMALWAKAMFWAAVASVFLTGAGVYLIYRTLLYTRDAAIYTGTAATAAERAAKSARDANELNRQAINAQERGTARQLRAYMHVSNAMIRESSPGDRVVHLGIKNYGQTPAHDVVTRAMTMIQKWPLEVELADPSGDLPAAMAPSPPGGETIADIQVAKPNAFEERELQAGRAAIYCWGTITYKVPVEATAGFMVVKSHRTHETRFRLACRGEGFSSGKMHHTEEGNSAT